MLTVFGLRGLDDHSFAGI